MMWGKADIEDGVLETRHTSYTISDEMNATADRVFRTPSIAVCACLSLFACGCWDLLYTGEKWALIGLMGVILTFGLTFTRLVIVKASLRGSELTVAGIGTYGTIRAKVSTIVAAAHQRKIESDAERLRGSAKGPDQC